MLALLAKYVGTSCDTCEEHDPATPKIPKSYRPSVRCMDVDRVRHGEKIICYHRSGCSPIPIASISALDIFTTP